MRLALSLFLAVGLVGVSAGAEAPPTPSADFYVSPTGNDTWSGTLASTTAARSDGPFATLARARDAVRELKEKREGDILVYIREGTYRLEETVVFGLVDSGDDHTTISYAAYPDETPVFTSAVAVEGWTRLEETSTDLSEVARGHVMVADVDEKFLTLYDGEGRLPRARSAKFAAQVPDSDDAQAAFKLTRNKLHYPEGTLQSWSNIKDVELFIRPQHAWIFNILPLASVNEDERIATTTIPGSYTLRPQIIQLVESELAWVENVLADLDEPGEWVLNTQEGKLYLWPRSDTAVVRPQLRELIRIEGEIDLAGPKDIPVRNLHFRGLSFTQGDRYTLKNNDAGLQHDWEMFDVDNALFRLRGAENCVIESCHFADSGGGAIRVDLHGQNIRIENNHIEKIGGTGILVSGYGPGTKDVSGGNAILNNHVHDYGEIYLHSPGIMLWQTGESRVANNLIHDAPYCGIIVSGFLRHFFERPDARELVRTVRSHEVDQTLDLNEWEAALPYLHTHDNLIEYNEIHHVMGEMADGNGIYIRGAGAGNVIRRNYIHHLLGPTRMQAAIRTDGGQRDTVMAENVIYQCTSKGIVLKLNNRVENNVVVDLVEAQFRGESIPASYLTLRESPLDGATIQRNIFSSSSGRATYFDETKERRFPVMARAKDADTDFNLYYGGGASDVAAVHLRKSQEDGSDAHSRTADPLLINPEAGDFRLTPGSPARALGIDSLDVSTMGLQPRPKGKAPVSIDWSGESLRDIVYKQVGATQLHMDVYLPPEKKFDSAPVVYFVHGGGWAAGSKDKFVSRLFLPVFKELAEAGFVGVSVQYRLARKGRGVLMRDCVTDAMDGLRYLHQNAERLGIDPERIVVFGDSAGGQLAQMLNLATPRDFRGDDGLAKYGVQPIGAVSWYGPTDFTDSKLFETNFSDRNPDRFGERIVGSGKSYADQPEAFEEMSPYYWIQPDSPPMLLIQGNRDATIPLAHAVHLQEKADRIGAKVESIIVENSGHNWRSAGGDVSPSAAEIQRITAEYIRTLVSPDP
ncbi:right-handed parallel beta-helix repeat-containing protein [Opitutaceae bacterium]|nr:right-handed parallel beta-helix repeat-containing protein [Opitutaceae bacterium]